MGEAGFVVRKLAEELRRGEGFLCHRALYTPSVLRMQGGYTPLLEDFFRRRNEIAHAIQIGVSGGPTSLAKDVEFFETVSFGLVYVLTHESR